MNSSDIKRVIIYVYLYIILYIGEMYRCMHFCGDSRIEYKRFFNTMRNDNFALIDGINLTTATTTKKNLIV